MKPSTPKTDLPPSTQLRKVVFGGALLTALLAASPARAGTYVVEYHETISDYLEVFYHRSVDRSVVHDDQRGTLWSAHTVLEEINDDFGNDFVVVSTFAMHESGPHSEHPNDAGVTMTTSVYGEDTTLDYFRSPFYTGSIKHESHFDLFDAELLARLDHFLGIDSITGYIWMNGGIHTTNETVSFSVHTSVTGFDNLPPDDSDSYGCLMLQINRDTASLNVAFAVANKTNDDILAAELHLGQPGQNGPLMMTLGTGQDFTNIDGNSSLYLRDMAISQEAINQIRRGNVYAVVRTQEYPNGEMRGQISAIPARFTNVQISGGALTATLRGLTEGQTVVLLSSSNLQDWTPIQTNAVSGSTLSITNPVNGAIPALFLRAAVN